MGMGRGIGRDRGEELQRIQPILYDEHEHEYQYQNNRQGYADGVCNSNNGDHNITDVYKNSSGRSAVVIASHPALSPNKKQSQPQDNNYKHNNLNNTHTHMYMQQRQTHNNARNLIHNQHMAYEKPREQYHAEIRDIRDRYLSVWEGDRQERQDRQEKQKYQMEYDRIIENYQARSSGPQTDGYRDR